MKDNTLDKARKKFKEAFPNIYEELKNNWIDAGKHDMIETVKEHISKTPYPEDVFVPNVKNDAIRKLWNNWGKSLLEALKRELI